MTVGPRKVSGPKESLDHDLQWRTQDFVWRYKFNSDYIFARSKTCSTCCLVPLIHNACNFVGINPFIGLPVWGRPLITCLKLS